MRTAQVIATAFTACIVSLGPVTSSQARDYPICSRGQYFYTGGGDTLRCEFDNIEQCRASISGMGGDCTLNPTYAGPRNQTVPRRASRQRG